MFVYVCVYTGLMDREPAGEFDQAAFEQSLLEEQQGLVADNVPEPIRCGMPMSGI